MTAPLQSHIGIEGGGNAGFIYVLRLTDKEDKPLGALTLLREAADGPLNHEQPNLTEAMRALLSEIVSA